MSVPVKLLDPLVSTEPLLGVCGDVTDQILAGGEVAQKCLRHQFGGLCFKLIPSLQIIFWNISFWTKRSWRFLCWRLFKEIFYVIIGVVCHQDLWDFWFLCEFCIWLLTPSFAVIKTLIMSSTSSSTFSSYISYKLLVILTLQLSVPSLNALLYAR